MSLLKRKISTGKTQDESGTSSLANLETFLKPLHETLSEALSTTAADALTPLTIKIDPAPNNLQENVLNPPSVKMALSCARSTLKGLGTMSPSLTAYMTQTLLDISEKGGAAENYIPTKLDTLLLRSFAGSITSELSQSLGHETALSIELSPDLESMALGKSDIEGLGELTQITFYFDRVDTDENETKSLSLYHISLFWPKSQLLDLSELAGSHDDAQTIHLDEDNPWTQHMRRSVRTAVVPLRAVVESCHMTIAECTRFEIGQVISLPGVSLGNVGMIIDLESDIETQEPPIEISRGSLGIFKKNRALKLTENIDAHFCENTDWLTV